MCANGAEAPLTFWIGSSGSATGFGVTSSIRDRWGDSVRVVALDTNPPELNAAATLADDYVQVPAAGAPRYAEVMDRLIAAATGPTIYIPIYDSEILEAARLAERDHLPPGFRVLTAGDSRAVAACNDKIASCEALAGHGLPVARTALLNAVRYDGPAVVKDRWGVGSIGHQVGCGEELQALQSRLDSQAFVVQDLCAPPEVTVDVFIGRAGGPNAGFKRVCCRERLQVKAGVITKGRIFEDADLTAVAPRVASAMDLSGSFCFQVMRSPQDGSWRIIDVNPRTGAGTRMCAAVGCDFIAANILDFLGDNAADLLPAIFLPQFVVRQYADYVTTSSIRSVAR
jgi:biotin carboxylase